MQYTRISTILTILILIATCENDNTIYQIRNDHVTEGEYSAQVLSPTAMVSNYPMLLSIGINQPLIFKLSLNGHDNEGKYGQDHQLVIPSGITEFYAPTLKFGEYAPTTQGLAPRIEKATNVHFRVNLTPVLQDFSEFGFYVTPTQDTVMATEFRGLYLAGGVDPLWWIWDGDRDIEALRFTDSDQDSIYELSITFDPHNGDESSRSWELSKDLSDFPQFSSPEAPLLEALTNMAMEEVLLNIRDDEAFSAGKEWHGVWTRDISYSAQLSLAYLFPENVKTSLRAKLSSAGRIIQDTGTGGSWPVSSDRHIWSLAAWEIFMATGDSLWLDEIRGPILEALQEDLLWNRDPVSGMLMGETSFEDWRDQTYPAWMTPADIHSSHALSTNIIFKRALEIGLSLAKADDYFVSSWPGLIERIDRSIINHFWNSAIQGPASYVITSPAWQASSHRDLLGESLGILFSNAFASIDSQLVASYPRTVMGSPVISHQLAHSPAYHNQAIWPFVEAYSLLAAKKAGNQTMYTHSFNGLIRSASLFLSHRENYHFTTGRPDQTEINSDRQLWSVSAWLAAIYKGLFGIDVSYNYETQGFDLLLNPNNPFTWDNFSLSRFKLHNTDLHIELKGRGSIVNSIEVNGLMHAPGKALPLDGNALSIIINLDQKVDDLSPLTFAAHTLPNVPNTLWSGDTLNWEAKGSQVILELNGRQIDTLKQSPSIIADSLNGFFSLRASNDLGQLSPPSVPQYRGPSAVLVLNTEPPNYIELGNENAFIKMSFSLPSPGNYLIHFIYSNGSGPVSTGNSCGLAKLKINDWWLEQMISFPHTDSWENWQVTAWAKAEFKTGMNTIILDQETLPVTNMNGTTNLFRVKDIEIIPVME